MFKIYRLTFYNNLLIFLIILQIMIYKLIVIVLFELFLIIS